MCMAASLAVSAALISEDDAKKIALEAAGFQEEDVTVQINSDREDGQEIYEIEIWNGRIEEYEYDILVETGEILGASYELQEIAGKEGTAVSLDEAKDTAIKHAEIELDEVVFTKEEREREDGKSVWELEFSTEDKREYEYEIDCETGQILAWSYDGERYLSWKEANQ